MATPLRKTLAIVMSLYSLSLCQGSRAVSETKTMQAQVEGAGSKIWCVAKPSVNDADLQVGLNFACGEGGADCSPIQPGGSCYNPNTTVAHTSYAYNSYFQKKGRNYWNCDFQNTALEVITDPSYGVCIYPDM